MEEKYTIPVLGESHYKELEEQRKKLNQQSQILLAEEETKGTQQMTDQAIEVTTADSPVEEIPTPKKKSREERIKEDMEKGKQVYNWVRLHENHFTSVKMRKLRKQEHGETMLVIYLKIVLHSLKWNGVIYYEEVDDSIAEEIAYSIGEDKDLVEKTILFMLNTNLATIGDNNEVLNIEEFKFITGPESNAERQRSFKAREYNKKLATKQLSNN